MTTEQVLNEGLARLRGLSETQNEFYQSARELLHQTLVETYLWWREASQKPGYLEKRFAEENIKYSNKLNRPNFAPVVRLAMRVQPTKRVQISNFATAMNAIDDEYIRNSHRYINRDVVAELVDWIYETGGLRGITGTKKEEVEYNGYDPKGVGKPKAKSKKIESARKKRMRMELLALKKIAVGKSKIDQTINIGHVGTGEDDMIVVLAKSTGNGTDLKVVGATAQQTLVDEAVMQISDLTHDGISKDMRLLCDAININTITKELQNYSGSRKNFYNKTKFIIEDNGVKSTISENTRVVLQRNGTILTSKSSSKASLTTLHIPHEKCLLDEDLWLRGSDRHWIETELLNDGEIALYQSGALQDQKNPKLQAVKQITLSNTVYKHNRSIYFYDFSRIDDATMFQPTIVDSNIDYDWVVEGNTRFFRRLYDQHFNGWQHRVKHRLHTKNNKVFAFDVTDDGIMCEKKWNKAEQCFEQTGIRYLTSFGDDAATKGCGKTSFAPTDMLAVLEALSKQAVKGNKITISGNADLLYIAYETDLAQVHIYIPGASQTGQRSSKFFKKYVPNE
ncbi:hypothetical protein RYZ18_10920 [Roseovarius sp. 10]|uniref:hypothetical protein n=1 Tax=Roseovarius sp. 10 TaxID=3080563 RepID=UPI002954C425|nr:hypothetical protein [Roseovarius sp. 10]MDV7201832.1 hypothetical protein [Roseovarius sp. 10]